MDWFESRMNVRHFTCVTCVTRVTRVTHVTCPGQFKKSNPEEGEIDLAIDYKYTR